MAARRLIREHGLPMKIVGVDHVLADNRTVIYFSAPHRVDFRSLVRDLGATLKGRVELRQLSARDEARVIGGIGSCGRDLCCSTFLVDFEPVSVRMAKDQDLPLNPLRISGACGRLMCCLKFEHPLYQDFAEKARRSAPACPPRTARATVVGHSVPTDSVVLRMNADGRRTTCAMASVCSSRKAHERPTATARSARRRPARPAAARPPARCRPVRCQAARCAGAARRREPRPNTQPRSRTNRSTVAARLASTSTVSSSPGCGAGRTACSSASAPLVRRQPQPEHHQALQLVPAGAGGPRDAEGEPPVDRGVAHRGDRQRHQVGQLRTERAAAEDEQQQVGQRAQHPDGAEPDAAGAAAPARLPAAAEPAAAAGRTGRGSRPAAARRSPAPGPAGPPRAGRPARCRRCPPGSPGRPPSPPAPREIRSPQRSASTSSSVSKNQPVSCDQRQQPAARRRRGPP